MTAQAIRCGGRASARWIGPSPSLKRSRPRAPLSACSKFRRSCSSVARRFIGSWRPSRSTATFARMDRRSAIRSTTALEGLRRIGWQASIRSAPRDLFSSVCTKRHARPCLSRCFAANRISMSWSWSAPKSCRCHAASARWTISPAERAARPFLRSCLKRRQPPFSRLRRATSTERPLQLNSRRFAATDTGLRTAKSSRGRGHRGPVLRSQRCGRRFDHHLRAGSPIPQGADRCDDQARRLVSRRTLGCDGSRRVWQNQASPAHMCRSRAAFVITRSEKHSDAHP